MLYCSTRNGEKLYSAAEAILQGLAPDGGLFVPAQIPVISRLETRPDQDYESRAAALMQPYLTGFGLNEIQGYCFAAYQSGRFDHPAVAPLHRLSDRLFFLELWHGPTSAFKDLALQLLPHLMKGAAALNEETFEWVILTATSGDTGKAALEGFRDIPGTRVIVFYPADGVSEIQKRQMITQEGNNVHVAAIRGNFDQAQSGVKEIFADRKLAAELADRGYRLSSANSINWGRLVPQIAYYYWAYLNLLRDGEIRPGEKIDFVVPTGNFGNILAGYYARRMGLPLRRLVCASNLNNVLADFIHTGTYNRNRPFHCTLSPSMDILISSNLERLLFELCGRDPDRVQGWMRQLSEQGTYQVDTDTLAALQELFWAGFATEEETLAAIGRSWREHRYLIDPHTAVARVVCDKYISAVGDSAKTVIVSTASPYKFNAGVARAILGIDNTAGLSEFALLDLLSRYTGLPVPPALAGLKDQPARHNLIIGCDEMKRAMLDFLR